MNIDYSLISVVLISMCVAASGILLVRDLISSLVVSGIFSLLAVVAYCLMKAPDVAITEVAVGASISTVFLMLTIGATGSIGDSFRIAVGTDGAGRSSISGAFKMLSAFLLFITLTRIVHLFPKFGDMNSLPNVSVGQFYMGFAEQHFGVHNVVTAVLGGYRGFDTLIETCVGFCASFGASQILSSES